MVPQSPRTIPARLHAIVGDLVLERIHRLPETGVPVSNQQPLLDESCERLLDQLFALRPTPSAARYKTAVPGLFLGGSGSHPGGGINPAPGLLAAEAVLAAG